MASLVNHHTRDYIKSRAELGMTESEIKVELLKGGWTTQQTNQLMQEYRQSLPLHSSAPDHSMFWSVSILVASIFVLSTMLFAFLGPNVTGQVVAGLPNTDPFVSGFGVLVIANIIFLLVAITFVVLTVRWEKR